MLHLLFSHSWLLRFAAEPFLLLCDCIVHALRACQEHLYVSMLQQYADSVLCQYSVSVLLYLVNTLPVVAFASCVVCFDSTCIVDYRICISWSCSRPLLVSGSTIWRSTAQQPLSAKPNSCRNWKHNKRYPAAAQGASHRYTA